MFAEQVDLNADVGEEGGHDAELMALVTSANVACGVHAGNENVIRATVRLARAHGVAVGAHPSFPDRNGFGRRPMHLPAGELEACLLGQVRLLVAVAGSERVRVGHVKPHGALYNMAAQDPALADVIARAVAAVDPSMILVGLAGSRLIEAGQRAGLKTASEVFADRGYRADGTLVSRGQPGSVLHDVNAAAARAVAMVREGVVVSVEEVRVPVRADTICVHGDTPDAVAMAAALRQALSESGVLVRALTA